MTAKIPQKYYFPQKNAQGFNLDVLKRGGKVLVWGSFLNPVLLFLFHIEIILIS